VKTVETFETFETGAGARTGAGTGVKTVETFETFETGAGARTGAGTGARTGAGAAVDVTRMDLALPANLSAYVVAFDDVKTTFVPVKFEFGKPSNNHPGATCIDDTALGPTPVFWVVKT
jgi:hypothetical protein